MQKLWSNFLILKNLETFLIKENIFRFGHDVFISWSLYATGAKYTKLDSIYIADFFFYTARKAPMNEVCAYTNVMFRQIGLP